MMCIKNKMQQSQSFIILTENTYMRRRRILFATFGVVASAGCIGSQEEPTGDQNEEEETRESTDPEADAQPEEPDPAEFEITDLVVEPTDISPGESVSVTTTVENVGDESGTYSVELQINSQVQDTTDVELGGGERSIVEFEYSIDTAGKYEVRVDTLKKTVMVTAEPDLTIQSKERASADTPYHDSYVEAVVENMGQARSGSVKVTARWFDESGSFIGDRSTYLPTLGVGETWIARIGLPRNGDQVKDFEITGQYEIQALPALRKYPSSPQISLLRGR